MLYPLRGTLHLTTAPESPNLIRYLCCLVFFPGESCLKRFPKRLQRLVQFDPLPGSGALSMAHTLSVHGRAGEGPGTGVPLDLKSSLLTSELGRKLVFSHPTLPMGQSQE